jgi:hypothetical protein
MTVVSECFENNPNHVLTDKIAAERENGKEGESGLLKVENQRIYH